MPCWPHALAKLSSVSRRHACSASPQNNKECLAQAHSGAVLHARLVGGTAMTLRLNPICPAQALSGAVLRARFAGTLARVAQAPGGARVLQEAGAMPALLGVLQRGAGGSTDGWAALEVRTLLGALSVGRALGCAEQ